MTNETLNEYGLTPTEMDQLIEQVELFKQHMRIKTGHELCPIAIEDTHE